MRAFLCVCVLVICLVGHCVCLDLVQYNALAELLKATDRPLCELGPPETICKTCRQLQCINGDNDLTYLHLTSLSGKFNELFGHFSKFPFLKSFHITNSPLLEGYIPPEIGIFTNVTEVVFSSTSVSGIIPRELCRLPLLKRFEISSNLFEGIPNDCFAPNQSLSTIIIMNNQIAGPLPESLRYLTQVTSMQLDGNSFSGPFIEALCQLSSLGFISVSNNFLSGPLPDCIGNMKLTSFQFAKNQFSGELPDGFYKLLQSTSFVDISNNQFSGQIREFTAPFLTAFNIRDNKFTGEPPHSLWDLPALLSIDAAGNYFHGQHPPLAGRVLSHVDSSKNNFTGVFPTATSKNLRIVNLHSNKISGPIPMQILCKPTLAELYLYNNLLTGSLPNCSTIVQTTALSKLHLQRNQLSGPLHEVSFAAFPLLRELDLSYNNFTGGIPAHVFSLQSLAVLDLCQNQLNLPLPTVMADYYPKSLEILDISSNRIIGTLPDLSQGYASLRYLNISNNQLTGLISPTHLLVKLTVFDCSNNRLTGMVSPPSNTEYIYLSNNNFFYGIDMLLNLPKVIEIIARNNRFTEALPQQLTFDSPLKVLDLANNRIKGQIPTVIKNMRQLERIDLSNNLIDNVAAALSSILQSSSVRYIDLSFNSVTSHELPKLELPSTVMVLKLRGCNLRGSVPESFLTNTPLLQHIDLSINNITGALPVVSAWLRIEHVDLSYNALYGTFPEELVYSPLIRTLNLSHNGFSGTFPEIYSTQLESLQLSHNQFSGTLREWFNNLQTLRTLDLSYNYFDHIASSLNLQHFSQCNGTALETCRLDNNQFQCVVPHWTIECCSVTCSNTEAIITYTSIGAGSFVLLVVGTIVLVRLIRICFRRYREYHNLKYLDLEQSLIDNSVIENMVQSDELLIPWSDIKMTARIGEGSFGIVYKGEYKGISVAVKTFKFSSSEQSLKEIFNEIRFLKKLKHPNIIMLMGACIDRQRFAIVLEFMDRGTLYHLLHTRRRTHSNYNSENRLHSNGSNYSMKAQHSNATATSDESEDNNHDNNTNAAPHNRYSMIVAASGATDKLDTQTDSGDQPQSVLGLTTAGRPPMVSNTAAYEHSREEPSTSAARRNIGVPIAAHQPTPTPVPSPASYVPPSMLSLNRNSGTKAAAGSIDVSRSASFASTTSIEEINELSWKLKMHIVSQIASGMLFLHLQSPPILHRDLKSLNVLVDRNFTIKITDFGFSREKEAANIEMTKLVGSIQYMAPELFTSDAPSTFASTSYHHMPTNTPAGSVYGGASGASSNNGSIAVGSINEPVTTHSNGTAADVYSFAIMMWEVYTQMQPWQNLMQWNVIAAVSQGVRPQLPAIQLPIPVSQSDTEQQIQQKMLSSISKLLSGHESDDYNSNKNMRVYGDIRLSSDLQHLLQMGLSRYNNSELHARIMPDYTATQSLEAGITEYLQRVAYLELMQACWQHDHTQRPTFVEISQFLKEIAAIGRSSTDYQSESTDFVTTSSFHFSR